MEAKLSNILERILKTGDLSHFLSAIFNGQWNQMGTTPNNRYMFNILLWSESVWNTAQISTLIADHPWYWFNIIILSSMVKAQLKETTNHGGTKLEQGHQFVSIQIKVII